MESTSPARIVMTRDDQRRARRILDAFAECTGVEVRRSERVAEFMSEPIMTSRRLPPTG
jgi:hypothetical protein